MCEGSGLDSQASEVCPPCSLESFVAGSDGYIYEGRGWLRQGAHTLGHNSVGYGVSFIGDYAIGLPSQHSMGLVRDQLAACAVGGGRLVSDFVLQGHRQVVATSCPGDALYDEIRGWEHFGVRTSRGRKGRAGQFGRTQSQRPFIHQGMAPVVMPLNPPCWTSQDRPGMSH